MCMCVCMLVFAQEVKSSVKSSGSVVEDIYNMVKGVMHISMSSETGY